MIGSLLGIGACITITLMSGFCSVYLEAMLKQTEIKLGIWHRNFQLALWTVIFLVIVMIYDSFRDKSDGINSGDSASGGKGFLQGWTFITVIICLKQAGGGLLVAATLKYADSILKTLAVSGAIVVSAVLGFLLLGEKLDVFVVLGCIATIIAIFNYSFDTTP